MPISRRKPFNYKQDKIIRLPKTGRTEMTVVERAYTIGAVRALRGDYANISDIARATQRSRHTISRLAQRVEERVARLGSKF
jgi:hypothetical protein